MYIFASATGAVSESALLFLKSTQDASYDFRALLGYLFLRSSKSHRLAPANSSTFSWRAPSERDPSWRERPCTALDARSAMQATSSRLALAMPSAARARPAQPRTHAIGASRVKPNR